MKELKTSSSMVVRSEDDASLKRETELKRRLPWEVNFVTNANWHGGNND